MQIRILQTSDVHAYIAPTDYVSHDQHAKIGLTRAAAFVKAYRENHDNVIYIDNGDSLQGSPLAQYLALQKEDPTPLARCLNLMGCDAVVLGNHDFNFGPAYLRAYIEALDCPVLGANIQVTDETLGLDIRPYCLIDMDGVKVAVLGMVTHFVPKWEKPEHIAGVCFHDPVDTARHWVPKLRDMADIVVVSYHGGFDREPMTGFPIATSPEENAALTIIEKVPGIDAMLTGHQHQEFAGKFRRIPLVQPGWRAGHIGLVEFEVASNEKATPIADAQAYLLSTEVMPPDPSLMAEIGAIHEEVQIWLDQPIGKIEGHMLITDAFEARLHGHPYARFVNELQMQAAGVDISATSIFTATSPGLPADVTVRHVVNNYVYSNSLAVLEVSGADLRAALERCAAFFALDDEGQIGISKEFSEPFIQYYNYDLYSGIDYTFDISRPSGDRVVRLDYQGKAVAHDDRLRIVMNNYRAVGGGEYPMFGPDKIVHDIEIDMTDMIVDYIYRHPVIQAQPMDNFEVLY